jgi:hypothetical protein
MKLRINYMVFRLYDLERITKEHWNAPVQWRYKDKNIEFGLETSEGISWFPYIQAPSKIVDLVCSYKKMQPKIGFRNEKPL